MLGLTVIADSNKAAHLCTCVGCSHSHESMANSNADDVSSHGMDQHEHQDENQPSHCNMNASDNGQAAFCACSTSSEKELPVLYNSLDKVALLAAIKTVHPSEKERTLLPRHDRDEKSLSKDVFHPPKRV